MRKLLLLGSVAVTALFAFAATAMAAGAGGVTGAGVRVHVLTCLSPPTVRQRVP